MNISWVLSDSAILDPLQDIAVLKNIGAFWGSWRTWRACQTDNVICNDPVKADDLIRRDFQKSCNFYIPNSVFQQLSRPDGVNLYEGSFTHDVEQKDEIVAVHLVTGASDIVLLLGFDFTENPPSPDRLQEHRIQNYRGLLRQAIKDNSHIQWVLVDHPGEIGQDMTVLENLTTDSMANVLKLLD